MAPSPIPPASRSSSLINGCGKAVRFSLRDKDRAIRVANCICFGESKWVAGKAVGHPNFMLMHKEAADQQDANGVNNPKLSDAPYQSDDRTANCDGKGSTLTLVKVSQPQQRAGGGCQHAWLQLGSSRPVRLFALMSAGWPQRILLRRLHSPQLAG